MMTTLRRVSVVGISITQGGKLAIATGEDGFSTMNRLIANNAAGGIRWNKPDAIESAYIEFATADDSVIATVVALAKDGNELTRFSHPPLAQPDLAAFAATAKGSRSEERRVGTASVSTGRSRWSPYTENKKIEILRILIHADLITN